MKKDVDAEAQAMFEPFLDWVVYGPRNLEELGLEELGLEELGYKPGLEPIKEEPAPDLVGAEDLDSNSYTEAEVKLPRDGHTFASAKVIGRARDECGDLIGKHNRNPLLDSSVY